MSYPVSTDYYEAEHVAKELGPQIQYPARQLGSYQVRWYVGHLDIQDQQSHNDGENGVAEEDESI
jgi:hypothetical protein